MKTKSFDIIIINGFRWFQKSYGNTYHSVSIEIRCKGKETVYLQSGKHYGYGDTYLQTAFSLLQENGYLVRMKSYSDFFNYKINCRDKFVINCQDVKREKDL